MDKEIFNLISQVGFPSTMCLLLLYYINKQGERHRDETSKLRDTLDNNTKVLTELTTFIKTLIK